MATKLLPSVIACTALAAGVFSLVNVFGLPLYNQNLADRKKVNMAPVVQSILPADHSTIYSVCTSETENPNQRYLCIERFKELNPGASLGRITRNTMYNFPDVNHDGLVGLTKK